MKVYNRRTDITPSGAVYVGRPSKWGNPFIVKYFGRQGAIDGFLKWMNRDTGMIAYVGYEPPDIEELKGKDLVCWCAPLPCHADILLKLANAGGNPAYPPEVR